MLSPEKTLRKEAEIFLHNGRPEEKIVVQDIGRHGKRLRDGNNKTSVSTLFNGIWNNKLRFYAKHSDRFHSGREIFQACMDKKEFESWMMARLFSEKSVQPGFGAV